MFLGKVIGTVWSTVKWPQVQGLKLLLVRPYHLADLAAKSGDFGSDSTGEKACAAEAVVCVDLLDAGVGDDVVVAFGHAARVAAEATEPANAAAAGGNAASGQSAAKAVAKSIKSTTKPIDAAVVAIVDSIAVARPST